VAGQIARNVTIDHLRRSGHTILAGLDGMFDQIDKLVTARSLKSSPDDTDEYADPETMSLVGRYLAGLPDDLKRVHHALYVQGLSQREAADALKIGRQAIRTLEARLEDGLRGEAGPRRPPRDRRARAALAFVARLGLALIALARINRRRWRASNVHEGGGATDELVGSKTPAAGPDRLAVSELRRPIAPSLVGETGHMHCWF
jgi:hypothetical protein